VSRARERTEERRAMVKARLKGNGMNRALIVMILTLRRSCYPGWPVPTFASPTFGVA